MSREREDYRDYETENYMDNKFDEKEEKPRSSAKRRTTDETVKKKVKIINTKLLNIRRTPDNVGDVNIITQLKEGEVVTTFGKENGYYKIKYKGEDAYILSDFCEEV